MRMRTRRLMVMVLALLGLTIVATAFAAGFGVEIAAATAPVLPPFDWQTLVQTSFAAVLPLAVYYIRKLKPRMPRIVVWTMAPALGGLGQYLMSIASIPGMAGWKGFLAGLGAIALNEFVTTLSEHGVTR